MRLVFKMQQVKIFRETVARNVQRRQDEIRWGIAGDMTDLERVKREELEERLGRENQYDYNEKI